MIARVTIRISLKRWVAILILVVVTAATFARVVGNDFVSWDDRETIARNERLNPPSIGSVAHYWRNAAGGLYIPVTYTYWSLLATVDGPHNPRDYHAASIVLHVAAALLVFSVVRQLIASDAAACVGALVFAVHPVQVESAAWASGAKDLLAGVFALAVIDQFLRYSAKRQAGGGVHYAAALVFFMFAILSKPSAIVAPLIAGALVWVKVRPPLRALLLWTAPMLLLAVACAVWSRAAQAHYEPTDTPLWTRPLVAADAVAFYLWKLAWPMNLAIIYGRTPGAVVESGAIRYTWILPVAVGALAWVLRRKAPWLLAGVVVFVLGLLPVLGFARFMFQIHSTVADHYLYLPMLGVALAVAGLVSLRPGPPVLAFAGAILLLLAVASFNQIGHWRDSEALYARVLAVNPRSAFARAGLGRAYAEAGDLRAAIAQFEAAVTLAPSSRTAHASLAQAYLLDGRIDDAINHANVALRLAAPGDDTGWERFTLQRALAARDARGATTHPAPP